jgi:hypothetical protein
MAQVGQDLTEAGVVLLVLAFVLGMLYGRLTTETQRPR